MTVRRRLRRPRWAPTAFPLVAAPLVVVVLALTGCASPGGGASAHNDVDRCATVLPLARDVVHGQGTLAVVHPVDRGDIDTITRQVGVTAPPPVAKPPPFPKPQSGVTAPPPAAAPAATAPAPSAQAGPPTPKACLVVYRGHYPAGAVPAALPPAVSGQYALIVLWVRQPAVYRVLVTDTLPAAAKRSWWHF